MPDMKRGWFADKRDDDGLGDYPWSPYLQGDGICVPLEIWFPSEADCEQWIRDNVIGKEMLTWQP